MHPLIGDLSSLKDVELESKINDLTKRYFASHNPGLQQQVIMVLETYKAELARRQRDVYEKMVSSRNKDLDKLINVQ
jgi:hypothetical protein